MKLYYSDASPFARKCRVVAIERGLDDQIELLTAMPLDNPDDLLTCNPLGRVPALILDDGMALTDSALICTWLDEQGAGTEMTPASWEGRRDEALATGVMEAAVAMAFEGRRPEAEQSAVWRERRIAAITRTLAFLEEDMAAGRGRHASPVYRMGGTEALSPDLIAGLQAEEAGGVDEASFDLADASLVIALDYLALRHGAVFFDRAGRPGGLNLTADCPALMARAAELSARESLAATKPG